MIELEDFYRVCSSIGARSPYWTQGAGSNVSLKMKFDGKQLLRIKASGLRMDAVNRAGGTVDVDASAFKTRFLDIRADEEAECELQYAKVIQSSSLSSNPSLRPSMETGFHVALEQPLVAHFHSIAAVLMADLYFKNLPAFPSWVAQSQLKLSFVDHFRPGFLLSRFLMQCPNSDAYVLRNHGVILASNDGLVLEKWQKLEKDFCREFGFEWILGPTMIGQDLQEILSLLTAAPLKFYFPDTAVFLERLRRVLIPDSKRSQFWVLKSEAMHEDRDMCELWAATALLYEACPDVAELPDEIIATVANLPVEKFRKSGT